jgi:iron complex transport system permease protein
MRALLLLLLFAATALASLCVGSQGIWSPGDVLTGLLGSLGLGAGLDERAQLVFSFRLHSSLTALGVGAALALSGALLQAVFRNDLASPSVIGVNAGAALGAAIVILGLGTEAGLLEIVWSGSWTPYLVSGAALLGGLATVGLVGSLAALRGGWSAPSLLLMGIAVNATVAGVLTLMQSLALRESFNTARAMMSWTFGNLTDRTATHAAMVWGAVGLSALILPLIARELDLLAAGEDDARALGVPVRRVQLLAVFAATLSAAVAVACAGQIMFVGLVVPHLLRAVFGREHRRLLPACLVGGPVFLVGLDTLQRATLGDLAMPPGVLLSMAGGPLFFFLLLRSRGLGVSW